MAQIKVVKNKNFTVMSNVHLNDDKLSWKAKGLLSYILSLPDDWKLYLQHLKTVSKDGRDSTNKGIDELMEQGYVVRKENKPIGGKFAGYQYTVYENPKRLNHSGETVAENPTVINTKEVSTKKTNTNKQKKVEDAAQLPFSDEIKNEVVYYTKINGKIKIEIPKLYTEAIETYKKFLNGRGMAYKFEGGDGKKMKEMLVWIIDTNALSVVGNPLHIEDMKQDVLEFLRIVFKKWDNLEPFYRDQIKLKQISSNITLIYNQLKNGATNKNGKSGELAKAGEAGNAYFAAKEKRMQQQGD